MRSWSRFAAIAVLAISTILALASAGTAQPRAHVYLFRGLADVYSLGMNTLADEINARGVYATAHSHTDWKSLADRAAADYKAGKEGPIILIGHSLGADAVMEMADYLGDKGVAVALVVPFDGTQSFPVPGNVGRAINFTQRDYAHMRPGAGFRGSLSNVDLSGDPAIDHLNIDKSPQLHARVIREILAIVGGHGDVASTPRAKSGDGAIKSTDAVRPLRDAGPPAVVPTEQRDSPTSSAAPAASPPPQKPVAAPQPVSPEQIPD